MKVEISYTFDASELGGQNLVTFEELYDLKNPEEPVKVAEHKDIDDEGQTVLITERKISIHTTATDKNGKKEMESRKRSDDRGYGYFRRTGNWYELQAVWLADD